MTPLRPDKGFHVHVPFPGSGGKRKKNKNPKGRKEIRKPLSVPRAHHLCSKGSSKAHTPVPTARSQTAPFSKFKIQKKIQIKVVPRSWSPPPRLSQRGHPPKLSHLKHKCKRRHWEQLGTAILRAIQFPPSTCPS